MDYDNQDQQPAGERLFNDPDLRHKILQLLDRDALAKMIRLEKAAIESVAEVLYKSVPASVISKMSRSSVSSLMLIVQY